jgi:hypothetical protein
MNANQNTLCVLVGERRENGGIWPLVTINLPENSDATMTGRKSAHLAVPVLRRALVAAELQAARNGPVLAGPVKPAAPSSTPPTTYSAGDGF